jgi:hypothetical protein
MGRRNGSKRVDVRPNWKEYLRQPLGHGGDHDLPHCRDAICVDSLGRCRTAYQCPSELHGEQRHVRSYGWNSTLYSPINGFRDDLQTQRDLG